MCTAWNSLYIFCGSWWCQTNYFITASLVVCQPLTAPSINGMIDCTLGDDAVANPGETCSFTCNGGLVLDGDTSRTCQDDGSWSGSDAMCKGVDCNNE